MHPLLLCGLIGAALGFGAFALVRVLHDERLNVHGWVLITAGLVSIGIGVGTAYYTNYLNQDVWTMDANGLAAGDSRVHLPRLGGRRGC
jgi:hypothetical protein